MKAVAVKYILWKDNARNLKNSVSKMKTKISAIDIFL